MSVRPKNNQPTMQIPPVEAEAPSLPPVPRDVDVTLTPPPLPARLGPKKPDPYKLPKNSLVRKKAYAIIALRASGMDDGQIAQELKVSRGAIHQYIYRARKAGYLIDKSGATLLDPNDELEFALTHKVVENLKHYLDNDETLSKGERSLRHETTLEIAKGVMFKRFDKSAEQAAPNMNVLQVKIEMPQTGQVQIREGAMGGTPNYTEGAAEGELIGQDRDD